MARRHYSDADRAAALAVYDSTADQVHRLRDAAGKAGVPKSTLEGWVAARDRAAPPEVRTEKIEDLADMMEDLARRCVGLERVALQHLEELPDDKRGEAALANLPALNRVGGTAIDKVQLLRNMPTDIHDVTLRGGLSDAARRELVDEINRDRNKAK